VLRLLLSAVTIVACRGVPTRLTKVPQVDGTVVVVTELRDTEAFVISGVAGVDECAIIAIGQEWGTVVRISGADGKETARASHRARQNVHLQGGLDSTVMAWSHYTGTLGTVDKDLTITDISVPPHPWDRWEDGWVGPAVSLAGGRIAYSPLGDNIPRAQDSARISIPLLHILDHAGQLLNTVGRIERVPGRYLSWVRGRSTLGAVGDTLLVVLHATAELLAFDVSYGQSPVELWRVRLPLYAALSHPREEVTTIPWVQVAGEAVRVQYRWPVTTATIADDGRIFVVRRYPDRGNHRDEKGMQATASGQVLEVYDHHGGMLGRFVLPEVSIQWLRIDRYGRLFLRVQDKLLIAQDPIGATEGCPSLPRAITLQTKDVPPSIPE